MSIGNENKVVCIYPQRAIEILRRLLVWLLYVNGLNSPTVDRRDLNLRVLYLRMKSF